MPFRGAGPFGFLEPSTQEAVMIGPTMPRQQPGGTPRDRSDSESALMERTAREVAENPEVVRELEADVFVAGFCVACGDAPALFATPYYFSPCRRCLAKRMRRLLATRDGLPWWVTYLAWTCEREIAQKDARAERGPTADFEPLNACAACGKLITLKESRYWFGKNMERRSSPPYCVACCEQLRAEAES